MAPQHPAAKGVDPESSMQRNAGLDSADTAEPELFVAAKLLPPDGSEWCSEVPNGLRPLVPTFLHPLPPGQVTQDPLRVPVQASAAEEEFWRDQRGFALPRSK